MKIELDIESREPIERGDIITNRDNSIIGICTFIRTDKTINMIVLYSKYTEFDLFNTYNVKPEEWYKYKGKITISNQ